MAYATYQESVLYIHGGFLSSDSNYTTRWDQFYSLDLSRNWNTARPLWSEVPSVGPVSSQISSAGGYTMSIWRGIKGKHNVTIWDMANPRTFAATYSFNTQSWEELPAFPPPVPGPLRFYQAATSNFGSLERVYIPGCAGTNMLVYDRSTNETNVLPMPKFGNLTSWDRYSFVWVNYRNSFFLVGGVGTPSSASYLHEYRVFTDAGAWEVLY
ncbi:hypothetical protein EC957_003402 [Mortierella hygrophila]|uniref:Kelch repeat protein n=1 Tax=Mortierella hygrophila TaxID=979708 RepID=A0A9P6F3I6_9FUNG|nr:hypothetical protein EC957_003402 [Mortierella hygrophila]